MKKVKSRNTLPTAEFYGTATVGTKGQIVIPNEVRKQYKIKTGDKLVVFSGEGGVIAIMKSDRLNDLLKGITAITKK